MEKVDTVKAIAIDGPSSAGKSTVAKELARRLGFKYIDTGAMYRAITLKVLETGVDPGDEAAVTALAESCRLELQGQGQDYKVFLDGQDVSEAIRNTAVTKNVSQVCSYQGVRQNLVAKQRRLAENCGVVMDGRDIGTNVLPNAALKIYLTASPEERGRRRYAEWLAKGIASLTLEEVIADLQRRDHLDSTREHNPLRRAEDAILLDSDGLSVAQITNAIIELWRKIQ